jgi:RNA polymerase sigma-70 factor (ECF subfamily)
LAEDSVQEALIKALPAMQNFQHRSSLKTWLRRITINQTITVLRKQKRLSEKTLDEFQPEFDNMDCRIEQKWDSFPTPEKLLERNNIRDHIEQALNSLPRSYSIIVRLRDVEGYDTKEVAVLLGLSESNVKVRLHRARSALKKILEPVLRGEEGEL